MAKKLNISFKDTNMDLQLYNEIITHTDKSAFVKEAVQFYLQYYKSESIKPSAKEKKPISSKSANEILSILG